MINSLPWIHGPATIRTEGSSGLKIPTGYEGLSPPNGKKFLALLGNLVSTSDNEGYIFQPEAKDKDWFLDFHYVNSGHVSDTDTIDAAELFGSMAAHSAEENKERKAAHLPQLFLAGWQAPPHYDQQTHHLEWAYQFRTDDGSLITNLNTRVLTRTGYYRVLMVGNVDSYGADRDEFNNALTSLQPTSGNCYSDFKSGDKLAEYGLMGLIGGGTAAVAVKTGLVGVVITFIVKFGSALFSSKAIVAVIGFFALLWRRLKGMFSRKNDR
ncbi:DUF2167 domain-containing protein [Asaia platycodi]|uniref:DUF2167 domain-containing protein n=1 Tax=Asaia platycodi TaxID=610243 RepID=UPI0004710768|nr:DUF2167 domain-containing protein [Asaia platycodi]